MSLTDLLGGPETFVGVGGGPDILDDDRGAGRNRLDFLFLLLSLLESELENLRSATQRARARTGSAATSKHALAFLPPPPPAQKKRKGR